jgi:hypothetical protein
VLPLIRRPRRRFGGAPARLLHFTFAILTTVGGLLGCDDPFATEATAPTRTDTLVAFAMTGSPPQFPSGYSAGTGLMARIEPDISFDVAFDLMPDAKIRIIPARLISQFKVVLGRTSATQQVGLLTPSATFESIGRAPESGYKRDSVVVVGTGQPVLLEVISDVCQFQFTFSSILYAKLVVDSVQSASRRIYFRAVRNPNCGFRSFQPGIPKN